LDGLRGVAILAVMATHARASGWAGDIGVDIFFVLSGFLITSLLIEEWDTFGSISLRRFYARRALRLLPALILMLAIVVIWHCLTNSQVAPRTVLDGLIALFYFSNWMFAVGFSRTGARVCSYVDIVNRGAVLPVVANHPDIVASALPYARSTVALGDARDVHIVHREDGPVRRNAERSV
jgi:hypothetical protein